MVGRWGYGVWMRLWRGCIGKSGGDHILQGSCQTRGKRKETRMAYIDRLI